MSAAFDLEYAEIADELAIRSFRHFVYRSWPVIEPSTPLKGGWHIDAIADHCEAWYKREILDLLINIPPRTAKSTIATIMLPAWSWLHAPWFKWLAGSYASSLSLEHANKSRRLMQSNWYQNLIAMQVANESVDKVDKPFVLLDDQNIKSNFENTYTGHRISTSKDGANTGKGGDLVLMDDPHNIVEGESEAENISTIKWVNEVMGSRLNDPDWGGFLTIMQRAGENDVSNDILNKGDAEHLNIPSEYQGRCIVEINHRCCQLVGPEGKEKETKTSIGFQDPRTEKGESIDPNRFTANALKRIIRKLGDYAYACQYLQAPGPRGEGQIKVDRIKMVDSVPHKIVAIWRAWDKAGTGKEKKKAVKKAAYTAGILMARLEDDSYIWLDARRDKLNPDDREDLIKATAKEDTKAVSISIEQEPGSGGLESAERTVRVTLKGYTSEIDKVTGSKEKRAEPLAVEVSNRNTLMLKGPWNKMLKSELGSFPNTTYKDMVDASSQCFSRLDNTPPIQVFF